MVKGKAPILTAISTTSLAKSIAFDCIGKGNVISVNKVLPGVEFSQQNEIVQNGLETESKLTGARICNEADGRTLKSFRLDWFQPEAGGSKLSSWVGPEETASDSLNCNDLSVPDL